MDKIYGRAVWVVFIACGVSYFLAIMLVAAYYQPTNQISYSTKITVVGMGKAVSNVRYEGLRKTMEAEKYYFPLFYGVSLLVLFATRQMSRSVLRGSVFAVQPLVFYAGIYGVFSIPFLVFDLALGNLDGEWLGEHWPVSEALGVWVAFSCAMAYISLKKRQT